MVGWFIFHTNLPLKLSQIPTKCGIIKEKAGEKNANFIQVWYRADRRIKDCKEKEQNKNVGKRLTALLMRAESKSREETAKVTGYKTVSITSLTVKYMQSGINAIVENHHDSNHRNMDYEKEEELLEQFSKAAENRQVVEVSMIKEAYDKTVGHESGSGQIYKVLSRHGWRKLMPRSRYPNKASDEAI